MATTIITRDGVALAVHPNENAAAADMLRRVPYSIDHATQHEGYALNQPEPWDADKAQQLYRDAQALFARHGHDGYWDDLTRENCGACVLGGFGADENGPNYAGWERAYVQAGQIISTEHLLRALNDENRAYAEALARDLATFR